MELVIYLHIFTCIWIKLGSLDAFEERWKEVNEADRTWMFRAGSDFSADERMIFEQITKGTNENNMVN